MNQANINLIKAECDNQKLTHLQSVAYILATTEHETAGTYEPVREAFFVGDFDAAEVYRRKLAYYPYYGRGFVQLTWRRNYKVYSQLVGKDLEADPDLALDPATAAFILVHGFIHGTFTGYPLSRAVYPGLTDYINARRCINGLDRAEHIADLAKQWQARMTQGDAHV